MKTLLLDFRISENVQPLALGYLKAYANKDITIESLPFDIHSTKTSNHNLFTKAMALIHAEQPQVIGFSCYMWNIDFIQDLSKLIKQSYDTKIILGGPEVSEISLNKNIDFIIHGQGEVAFKALLEAIENTLPVDTISNLTYWKDNKLQTTKIEEQNIELDILPNPYKSFTTSTEVIQIETSRGCIFQCAYCNYARKKYREFSLDYIENILKNLPDFKVLTILDANFNYNEKRMIDICNLIAKHCPNKKLVIELNPMLITQTQIDAIQKASPYVTAEIGLQSTDKEVNNACNREINLEKIKQSIQLLNKSKIKYKLDLIFGLPKDNFFKFLSSTKFILNNTNQNYILAHQFACLNNTDLEKGKSHFITKSDNQNPIDLLRHRIYTTCLNEELKHVC